MTQEVAMDRPARGRVARWFARFPGWARGVTGLAAVALGVAIITRPTTALGVLALLIGAGLVLSGVLELLGADDTVRPAWRTVLAATWVVAGLLVFFLPGLTVRLVAVVVGVSLVVNGVVSAAAAARKGSPADSRLSSLAFGLAGVVFGVLALAWPDVTLLVVAVVFGARLIMGGLAELWRALQAGRPPSPTPAPGRWQRWRRGSAAVAALLLAGGAAVVSASLQRGSPVLDDFYASPRDVPAQPGQLVRSEPFTRQVPANTRAWRILYTTTRGDGSPALASGLVVEPATPGPHPVIDWTHGTTGFAENCAPSILAEPFESGALMVLPEIVDQGWAVVATDYIGLGSRGPHAYLVGPDAAHGALDAVRAARQLPDASLGDQTVVWGHSQGGGAALWTGALATGYAPDVPLTGVAALAPASNLPGLVKNLPNVTGGSIFASFVLAGYSATYADVTFGEYVRPGAETIVQAMSERCLSEPGTFVSVLQVLGMSRDPDITARDPLTGALGARLDENTPPPTVAAPLLLAQGGADSLVVRPAQDAFVAAACAAGQQLDYRVYAGRDHVPLVEADSPLIPDLVAWTKQRLAGEAVEPGCSTTER